jgi:phosphopantothenoylcysteine decarboxylase/phosphopantothenate--cysteine ligase
MLVTTYLSAKCPVFVAPAMDLDMYKHPSTQKNISVLKDFGCCIIEPGEGELASGLEGKGRMEEPENILQTLVDHFNQKKNC